MRYAEQASNPPIFLVKFKAEVRVHLPFLTFQEKWNSVFPTSSMNTGKGAGVRR